MGKQERLIAILRLQRAIAIISGVGMINYGALVLFYA